VCFRIGHEAGRYFALGQVVSRTSATRWTRKLLTRHGYDAATFTEKSLKVDGVTSSLDGGEPLENVQALGGWKSLETPLCYRNSSVAFKLGIASRIPVAATDSLVASTVGAGAVEDECAEEPVGDSVAGAGGPTPSGSGAGRLPEAEAEGGHLSVGVHVYSGEQTP